MKELQSAQKQIGDLKSEVAQAQLPLLTGKAETLAGGARLLAVQVDGIDAKSLQVSPPLPQTLRLVRCLMCYCQAWQPAFVILFRWQ